MKILVEDKIVESYRFTFTEALSFGILIWTMWGLAEAFYWQKLVQFFNPQAEKLHAIIYLEAFLAYSVTAFLCTLLAYSLVRVSLVAFDRLEPYLFRGVTLSTILGSFFLVTLNYNLQRYLINGPSEKMTLNVVAGVLILLAVMVTLLLFKMASNVAFRLRRSGTTMLSILLVSLILSFVPFPIFSSQPDTNPDPQQKSDYSSGIRKLMAYHYAKKLLPE